MVEDFETCPRVTSKMKKFSPSLRITVVAEFTLGDYNIHMTNNKELIVIVAHPDDESFAFSGIIQRALAKKYTVLLHTLTKGEGASLTNNIRLAEEMVRVRAEELGRVVNKLGIRQFQYDLPDGELTKYPEEITKIVNGLIEASPNAVFATTFYETTSHPDHKQIAITLEKLKPANLLFHFRPDRWQAQKGRQYQIDLTNAESRIKKEVLLFHESQRKDVDRYLESYAPVEYFFSEHPTEVIDELFLP